MSTYFDKKKLLEDNSDLYISSHDKALDFGSLSGIIDAKRSYENAKKAGNTKEMKKSNDKANALRETGGLYNGGEDGSEYNAIASQNKLKSPTYSSPYDKKRESILKSIDSYGEFSYDPYEDPLFKSYVKIYSRLGDDAFDRALSAASLRTGGIQSSSALSLALGAKSKFNSELINIIPKLYENAYKQYMDGYDKLYRRLDATNDADALLYDRYRDDVSDYQSQRDYLYKKEKDTKDLSYDRYMFETNTQGDRYEFDENLAYKNKWANMEDSYKRAKLGEDTRYHNLSQAINLAKAIYGKAPVSRSVIDSVLSYIK